MNPSIAPKPRRFYKLRQWIRLHRTRTYLIVGVFLIAIAGLVAAIVIAQNQVEPLKIAYVKPKPKPIYYAPLTGKIVPEESDVTKPVTAIMIENSPDARPQSGLKSAEIVYEAVAEGGITRFLALYQQEKPKIIGPVRSLRMYYVDWATPYNASIAHVGGSYKALQVVRKGSYRDIDQFFNAGTYWRAADRYAPHNVYTSSAKLDALNKAKGYKMSKPKVFDRKEPVKASGAVAKTISLGISGPLYNSTYTYDATTKHYLRSQAGAPHIDREKGRIAARVVIALKVDMKQVLEDGYRESITTAGPGEAYIFENGHVNKVRWQKGPRAGQISFTMKGKPYVLSPGKTWITAIPNGSGSVSWK